MSYDDNAGTGDDGNQQSVEDANQSTDEGDVEIGMQGQAEESVAVSADDLLADGYQPDDYQPDETGAGDGPAIA